MKLTPHQRIEAYEHVRDVYLNIDSGEQYHGMCILLYLFIQSNYGYYDSYSLLDNLPELLSLRPPQLRAYWFKINDEGKRQRVQLLTQAIDMAKNAEV